MRTSDSSAPVISETVLRGTVDRITFRNQENGYTVLQLVCADATVPITVVGHTHDVATGSTVVVRGEFTVHRKFGKQFQARAITTTVPETPEGLVKYLSSGVVKGIGEKTAERIVSELGTSTMEVIYKDPARLAAVQGVGAHKAKLIADAFTSQSEVREIMKFLLEHNISQNLAMKIFERYGARAIEVLSRDPYLLARSGGIRGVGFLTADSIAAQLGITATAPQRVRAGLYFALEKAVEEGHCYLSLNALAERARMLLSAPDELDLTPQLQALQEERAIVMDEGRVALTPLSRAEEFVARFIADRSAPLPSPLIDAQLVNECLIATEQATNLQYSPDQREAVLRATQVPLLLITGGPGCGKTTLIKAITTVFRAAGKRLVLAAPTGRAAQRMSQVCDAPASTIHRLLKFDPSTGHFVHGIHDPLSIDAIIIDEASMIDIVLAKDLFSAIPLHAPLILVGDKDQLPSVGPGRVFGDLLSLHELPIVSLSRLFRRAEESKITTVAHQVNAGITPTIPEPDGSTKTDAYFLPVREAEEAAALVERLVADQLPKKFGFRPEEIVVLTPSNRGPLGTSALNQRLQKVLNPPQDTEQELSLQDGVVRLGDRVCQRVNNYQIDTQGVYNGDGGTVYAVRKDLHQLTVELWDGRLIPYDSGSLNQLSLAYAVTVHRSQGSEYPCVVLVLHDSQYTLLERQLIYTAITRAKKLLVLVGSKRALSLATARTSMTKRGTTLRERIRTFLK